MVEGSGFENRRTLTGTRGSNPFSSAGIIEETPIDLVSGTAAGTFTRTSRTARWRTRRLLASPVLCES